METEGQISPDERGLLTRPILAAPKVNTVLEIGTWLGVGSTIEILRALQQNNNGHLWGIEADAAIYERMIENLKRAAPEAMARFTPLFGRSQKVIPKWIAEQGSDFQIDLAFLDGGNNPLEQITEFHLIDPHMPLGAILMTHDAKLRKGKWLVPYISRLDNWESKLYDVSDEGLFFARKSALHPSPNRLRSARSQLRRMRLAPAEIAAAILPAKICRVIFSLMPDKLTKRLAEGR